MYDSYIFKLWSLSFYDSMFTFTLGIVIASNKYNILHLKKKSDLCLFVCLVVFSATFNNISVISWWSVLLVEETGRPGENHCPVASH